MVLFLKCINQIPELQTNILLFRRYSPTQADVAVYKATSKAPDATKYPHAARWYKHITAYVDAFESLPGDASLPASSYGPDVAPAAVNPSKAPAADEDDDDVDLFGSDDEEDDAEKAALTKKRLEEYAAKKVQILFRYLLIVANI